MSFTAYNAGSPGPDAREVRRNRDSWKPLSRSEALRACRTHPVVVMHRDSGPESAAWLTPSNRFFKSDGPYLYSALRYFQYRGSKFGVDVLTKLASAPPPQLDELEPLEAMDMSGAALSLSSPSAKKPALPSAPQAKIPSLPEIPEQPKLPELPDLPELPEIPNLPELPEIPDLPGIPNLPSLPDLALPSLPEGLAMPAFPVLPELVEKPELIPIEFRLLDGLGKPLPPTFFRVSLPDGSERTGKSDDQGFIRIPDNTQKGESKLELLDHEPAPGAIAGAASAAQTSADAKHPIEIKLVDGGGKAMPEAGYRIKLSNGQELKGKSDAEGFIRIPDNMQGGELELILTDFEPKDAA